MCCGWICAAKWMRKSWSRTRLRTKKGACKEHADPLKWQIKAKQKGQRSWKCGKDCWARIFSWLREHSFQRNKGMQAEQTEEEEVRQQTRMDVMKRMGQGQDRFPKPLVG